MNSLRCTLIFGTALGAVLMATQLAPTAARAQDSAPQTIPAAQAATAPAPTIPPGQQATREQLIKLFTAMRLEQQMDAFTKRVPVLIQQQIKAQTSKMAASLPNGETLTVEQQAAVDRISNQYMKRAMEVLTMQQLEEDLIPIYQKHLAAVDVDAYIAFYQSPAGQHLLDQQPAIMEEYLPIAIKHAQASSKQLTTDLVRDLTAAVKPAPAAPGSAPAAAKPAPQ